MSEDPIERLREVRLGSEWFGRDVLVVAEALIGTVLVYKKKAGIIVETEAYLGPEDLASHTRFGPTKRTSVMFGPGGFSYVYLCYGVHEMFNIVTGRDGEGQAVLIRAIAPYLGLPDDSTVGRGPGKVTTALGIDRRLDRKDLAKGPLFVAQGLTPTAIARGPRIGVSYAKEWAEKPYRFWWRDHPSVSRPAVSRPAVSRPAAPSRPTVATTRKR